MKKRLLILMTVTGMIILLGGLLTYGLGVHEIIPVPRPDLIVVGTSLIGILLIVSGVCDLFVKKTKEMEIEENDERNISLSNAAMASGFKVMNVTIAVSIFALIFTGYMTVVPCFTKEATVETKELYYPQISAQAGSYTFEEGVELEIYSSKSSYYDWAKIRFTSQFRPKLSLKKKDPATIQLGYDGTLEDVFTGFVSGNYDGGTYANEVALKDEMLLMEETIINDTFLDTTPQELISYFLAQAGLSKMKLSSKTYPTRKMLPIRRQTAVQAINAVNAAWGLRVPFFFSGGVFYWDEKPEQKKVYTFERGVNILNLRRAGGVWELETVSAPFIKHSHKINLIHPQVSGEVEVSKVVSKTNDSGFIRTYIYF